MAHLFIIVVSALILSADGLDLSSARLGVDGGRVAVVAVDADKVLAVGSSDALQDNVALGHGVTVSAGAVQLTEVCDCKARDSHSATAVVLDDLVLGALRSTADDVEGAVAGLEGEGVYYFR